jgi:hypothetical protein
MDYRTTDYEHGIDLNTSGRFNVVGIGPEPNYLDLRKIEYKPEGKFDPNNRTVKELALQTPQKNAPDVEKEPRKTAGITPKKILTVLGAYALLRLILR